jgi:hypothetical protein
MRLRRQILAVVMVVAAASSIAEPSNGNPLATHDENSGQDPANAPAISAEGVTLRPQEPDTDLLALMSGKCSTLRVAGRDYACRTVAYAHGIHGRAYFTIALEDSTDHSHIISFSGENSRRSQDNVYELTVDRVLLNSKNRPKVDGLPVPFVELSAGTCTQLGNFAAGQVSSIACSATDRKGSKYELQFESDGLPITIRRVKPSPPTIRERT